MTASPLFTGVISLWVLVYSGSVVRWLWQQRNYRGAVGLAILASLAAVGALLAVVLPD